VFRLTAFLLRWKWKVHKGGCELRYLLVLRFPQEWLGRGGCWRRQLLSRGVPRTRSASRSRFSGTWPGRAWCWLRFRGCRHRSWRPCRRRRGRARWRLKQKRSELNKNVLKLRTTSRQHKFGRLALLAARVFHVSAIDGEARHVSTCCWSSSSELTNHSKNAFACCWSSSSELTNHSKNAFACCWKHQSKKWHEYPLYWNETKIQGVWLKSFIFYFTLIQTYDEPRYLVLFFCFKKTQQCTVHGNFSDHQLLITPIARHMLNDNNLKIQRKANYLCNHLLGLQFEKNARINRNF